jgi:hypothetical protein
MKNLLGAMAIVATGLLASAGGANAAPVMDVDALATTAQSEGLQEVHWRRYFHCHRYRWRRFCHGGRPHWRRGHRRWRY